MSYLRQKSDFNIDAAKELISKQIYAPSVHCSYYSCFQLLMFIIQDFFGIGYEAQKRESKSSKQTSHNYVIHYIANQLNDFEKEVDVRRKVIRQVKQLKQLRVESDYHDIEIGIEKSSQAITYAINIRSYVADKF